MYCNFVFPEGLDRPKPNRFKGELTEDIVDNIDVDEQIEKSEAVFDPDEKKKIVKLSGSDEENKGVNLDYQSRIEDAIVKLRVLLLVKKQVKKLCH